MEMDKDNSSTKEKPDFLTSIYRINKDLTVDKLISNISCTNSICFNVIGDIMYYCDSLFPGDIPRINYINYLETFNKEYKILNNLEQENKHKNDIKILSKWNKDNGVPDGSCIDFNDNLWNARIFNGKIIRYDNKGKENFHINIPDLHCSCPCFGGTELDTLYITTIGDLADEITKKQNPKIGGLYSCKVPFKGLKESRFLGVPQEYTY